MDTIKNFDTWGAMLEAEIKLENFLRKYQPSDVCLNSFPTVIKWYFIFHQQAAFENSGYQKRISLMFELVKIVWAYDQKYHHAGNNALDAFEHGLMRVLPPYPAYPHRVEEIEQIIKDFKLEATSLEPYYEFQSMLKKNFVDLDDDLLRYFIFLCQDFLQKFSIDFADFYYKRPKDKYGKLISSDDEDYQLLYGSLLLPYYKSILLPEVNPIFISSAFRCHLQKKPQTY